MERKSLTGAFALIICVIASMLCSCAESKLKLAAEAANKNCPVSFGMIGELTSVTYDGNTMEFLLTMDEEFTDIDKLGADPERMKTSLMAWADNEKTRELFEMIIDADASLTLIYRGKTSGKEARAELTSSELKKALDSPMATAEEKLKLAIEQTNLQMPMDTGTGVVITELVDEGDVVVYIAKVTDLEQFKMLSGDIDNIKNSQRLMFKMMGPAEKMFFKTIVEAGKDLGYMFCADGTDETIKVIHTNAELKEFF